MNPVVVRNLRIGEGIPKICVPIVGKTREEILLAAKGICNTPADLVEWRVDWFESVFDIDKVTELTGQLRAVLGEIPLLFTFRTKAEGGQKDITYDAYAKLLKQVAITKSVDMIDVEVFANNNTRNLIEELKQSDVKVIGSNHDFAKTPDKEEIIRRLCYMQKIGADIPKIAVMPQNANDVIKLLDATEEMADKHAECPIITMSMSGKGVVSRIAGEIFGSSVTFGSVGQASAPGQIDVHELSEILKITHRAQ